MAWHPSLGGRHRVGGKSEASDERRRQALHTLLDRVLSEGVTPVEVESDLVDLLNLARRRRYRNERRSGSGEDS